jgi:putative colanic acid biosynthesis acetyltransferase WcaF
MANLPQLNTFDNRSFHQGTSQVKVVMWYVINHTFINSFLPFNGLKKFFLRLFGAKIGKGVLIKPFVNIKYPWKLIIGNDVWIGEKVWIDNLDNVRIEHNVCISQGAMLLCGNHNYKKTTFDLITAPIILEEGVWICAKAMVGPGVVCEKGAILSPNSFANGNLKPMSIYSGVPAQFVKER